MIRYQLICDDGHRFDAWFRSSGDCDRQLGAGLAECPHCGSPEISKALMAPSLNAREETVREVVAAPETARPEGVPARDAVVAGEAARELAELRERMRALREDVMAKAEHVGTRFPEEARRIHYGEREAAGIWGEATPDEARSLAEEGIAFAPLPIFPDERN
ncbi:MAG: DUF1178 family protein [Hyphomicrobiaceae bacterium]|nr:DUF1178 family protein [Hyphomicrobiaceae bacterium]